jgi:hypothetical protein
MGGDTAARCGNAYIPFSTLAVIDFPSGPSGTFRARLVARFHKSVPTKSSSSKTPLIARDCRAVAHL